jgi:hypothetical protein
VNAQPAPIGASSDDPFDRAEPGLVAVVVDAALAGHGRPALGCWNGAGRNAGPDRRNDRSTTSYRDRPKTTPSRRSIDWPNGVVDVRLTGLGFPARAGRSGPGLPADAGPVGRLVPRPVGRRRRQLPVIVARYPPAMRIRLRSDRRNPESPSAERETEVVGVVSPGVRDRRFREPRPDDFNARLRKSVGNSRGEAPTWRT